MVHRFAFELSEPSFWPNGCHEFPCFTHRYFPDQPPPVPGVSKEVIWCASCRCLIRLPRLNYVLLGPSPPVRLSVWVSLANNRSHSRTILAADHASTCTYRLLSFPISTLADIVPLLFDTPVTPELALNHHLRYASRRRVSIAGVGMFTSLSRHNPL